MKMYDKKELKYKNGLIVAPDGEVVGVDPEIVDLANELETAVQKSRWLATQPTASAGPDFDKFERETEAKILAFTVDTPVLDKKIDETLAMMEEIDLIDANDKMNEALLKMTPLVLFVKDDSVVSCSTDKVRHFDCPVLGNPLEWTEDTLVNAVALVNGARIVDADSE